MFGKNAKGFIWSVVILLIGLFVAANRSQGQLIIISIFTVLIMILVVNRFIVGTTAEIFISGFILGGVEAYVFFIQPYVTEPIKVLFFTINGLPAIPGTAKLFFGVAFVTRATIFLLEMLDTPLKKPIGRFLEHK